FGLAAAGGRALVIDATASVGIRPRIDRVMKHPAQHARSGQTPFQLTAPRSSMGANSQPNLVPRQITIETHAGAQLVELVEDQLHGRTDLLVWIECNFVGR